MFFDVRWPNGVSVSVLPSLPLYITKILGRNFSPLQKKKKKKNQRARFGFLSAKMIRHILSGTETQGSS